MLKVDLDGAVFYFPAVSYKDSLLYAEAFMDENAADRKMEGCLKQLVAVENLYDPENRPVTIAELKEQDAPIWLLQRLTDMYWHEVAKAHSTRQKGAGDASASPLVRMLASQLYQSNLICPKCVLRSLESQSAPACKLRPSKCDIEDLMALPREEIDELLSKVRAFVEAKMLDAMGTGAYGRMQEKILDNAGLFKEPPSVLVQMETVWREHQESLKTRT